MSRERRRVAKSDVRDNARRDGGGSDWFSLPKGVETWAPDKPGTYLLDILPYETTDENHPDKVEKGTLWYKRRFKVHHNVGPNNESVVCPGSIGKPCPLCQEQTKLKKDWDANEDKIKALNPQSFMAFNLKDPEDEDKIRLYAQSVGKFWKALQKEIDEGDEENLNFYDVNEDGRTLKVRFSESVFDGRKFLEATRIDFKPRAQMDEDETLGRTLNLDEILKVMGYEELKKLWLQVDEDEDEDKDKDEKGKGSAKKKDEASGSGEKTTSKSAKFKKGDLVTFKNDKGKTITGKVTEIDDDDVIVEDEDGDEHDAEMKDLKPAKGKEEPKEEAKPKAEAAKSGKKFKPTVGQMVTFEHKGKSLTGKVTEIDDDDVTIEDKDKKEYIVDESDVKGPAEADEEPKKEGKAGKETSFKPGDEVTWEDEDGDDVDGEIIKIHSSGEKAKVKDEDGNESWVAIKDLTKS